MQQLLKVRIYKVAKSRHVIFKLFFNENQTNGSPSKGGNSGSISGSHSIRTLNFNLSHDTEKNPL